MFDAIRRGAQALLSPLFGPDWQRTIQVSLDDQGLSVADDTLHAPEVLKRLIISGRSAGSSDGSLGFFVVELPKPPDESGEVKHDRFWVYLRADASAEEAATLLASEIQRRSVFDVVQKGSEVEILSVKLIKPQVLRPKFTGWSETLGQTALAFSSASVPSRFDWTKRLK